MHAKLFALHQNCFFACTVSTFPLPTLLAWILLIPLSSRLSADDWITWTSTYTHEPVMGQRIDQYALPAQPVSPQRQDFVRSGFRNYRSTLQAGQSADNIHITEQWGRQVIPYEHWRFPYRPYGVPYDAWGPPTPYGIFNGTLWNNPGWGGYGGNNAWPPSAYGSAGYGNPGYGGASGTPPGGAQGSAPPPPNAGYFAPGQYAPGQYAPGTGFPRGFPLTPPYRNEPWYDGTYPDAPPLDSRSDREFFFRPGQ